MKKLLVTGKRCFFRIIFVQIYLPVARFKSGFEKYLADPIDAEMLSITGSEWAFFLVISRSLESIKNRLLPSLFSTKIIGNLNGLIGRSIVSAGSPFIRGTWVQYQVEKYQRLKKWYFMPPYLALSTIR